ncbi:MAG: N,N-dimethylformamidase beta subunit family domain-containing protein [Actinomycetota bacterium]
MADADDITFYDDIEGYCGAQSYRPGETATVHVSTRGAAFDVLVERWGASREQVWAATEVPGAYAAPPEGADADGCDWPVSVEIPIGVEWPSGFHLVTLRLTDGAAEGRDTAHAFFVVRPRAQRADLLLVLATNTWNAYNTWGGASLYTGGKQVSFQRPMARGMLCRPETERDDRKARPTRWDEAPDPNGEIFQRYRHALGYPAAIGSSGWFSYERRFVEWAESHGYTMDYVVQADVDADPEVLDGYALVLGVGHHEYWSGPERDAVERYVGGGGHLATFSGNTMFWQVRLEPGPRGERDTMVCHKYSAHETDPVVAAGSPEQMSGLWCDPLVGRPEWTLLGGASAFGLYYRFGQAVVRGAGAFTVYRADHWLLEGTGLGYGDLLGARDGVVGYETLGCRLQLDEFQLPVAVSLPGMPRRTEVVAYAPSSNLAMGEYPASISALSDQGDLEFIASRLEGDTEPDTLARYRYGNAVMLVTQPYPGGGEVVTVGTTDWTFGLAADEAVAKVTANVLDRYLRRVGGDAP